jgi:hypothetical protein
VENIATVPLHFTLELEGQGNKEVLMDVKPTWQHGMQCIMIHGLLDFVSNTKPGDYDT